MVMCCIVLIPVNNLTVHDINIRQEGLCHPDVDMSNLLVSYGEIAPVIQLFAVFGSLLDEN